MPSAIIGYAVIASKKWVKNDLWWLQEKEAGQNKWPYVFTLDEVYLFDDALDIDFTRDNLDKSKEQLTGEVEAIAKSGMLISEMNQRVKQVNPELPAFPVNGSASRVNEAYEKLILEDREDFFLHSQSSEPAGIIERLDEVIDQKLSDQTLEAIWKDAEAFRSTGDGYTEKEGVHRVRKDNETQKRRVARIENYTCQVCGYYREYTRKNGSKGWIAEVDHIVEKHLGSGEEMKNLWVLCPNCHTEKTRGVIILDCQGMRVLRNNHLVTLNHDAHLFI